MWLQHFFPLTLTNKPLYCINTTDNLFFLEVYFSECLLNANSETKSQNHHFPLQSHIQHDILANLVLNIYTFLTYIPQVQKGIDV